MGTNTALLLSPQLDRLLVCLFLTAIANLAVTVITVWGGRGGDESSSVESLHIKNW